VRPRPFIDTAAALRFRCSSLPALLTALALAFTVLAAIAVSPSHGARGRQQSRELVVGFDHHSSPVAQRQAVAAAGGAIEHRLGAINAAVVTSKGDQAGEVAGKLADAQGVDFVEPNYVVKTTRLPNDPEFRLQWALRNHLRRRAAARADISAAGAWNITTGGRVTVAVADTGIDYTHPDLARNVWTNPHEAPNGIDDDGDGFVDDVHGVDLANHDADPMDDAGHGTHVAGIIGARGDNRRGTAGVNWKVRLMPVKFLDANGMGDTAGAAQAIDYAVANGAQVINASWAVSEQSYALSAAIENEYDLHVVAAVGCRVAGDAACPAPDVAVVQCGASGAMTMSVRSVRDRWGHVIAPPSR